MLNYQNGNGCITHPRWRDNEEPEHHSPDGNLTTMPKIGYGSNGGFASRVALVNELHRRAPDILELPSILTHLAVLRPECMSANEEWNKNEWEHLCKLCELLGHQPPPMSKGPLPPTHFSFVLLPQPYPFHIPKQTPKPL
eukprot:276112-Prorocentrum_minimum.AAC.4